MQASVNDLLQFNKGFQTHKERAMKKTILLTGATGALGSMLLPRFIANGFRVVCLVRPGRDGTSPRARLKALVSLSEDVEVIEGDITLLNCGVSEENIVRLGGRVDSIFHSAASLNFVNKEEARSTNEIGVCNMLGLAGTLSVNELFHVSTVYVAGNAERFSEKDMRIGQQWRNPYEKSKYHGEMLVRRWAAQNPKRRLTVFRPSILIGCEDGTTPTFDGWYGYFRPIYGVARAIRRSARKRKELPLGISVTGNRVDIPLVLRASAHTRLNVVPIDWEADRIIELVLAGQPKTFHLIHPGPPLVRDVISASLESLMVGRVVMVETAEEKEKALDRQKPLIRRLQGQIDVVINNYVPYTTGSSHFTIEAARQVLGADFQEPPPIDQKLLSRLLNWAIETEWKKQPIIHATTGAD